MALPKIPVLLPLCLAGALLGCNSNDKAKSTPPPAAATTTPPPRQPLSVEDSADINVTAKVKRVDQANRLLTLEDDAGHEMTFKVDPIVQRLGEVDVGDNVHTRYRVTLLAELRPATQDEIDHPIAYVGMGERAPKTSDPRGQISQAMRVVTTVMAVDVPNMLVTLRGPMGDLAVVRGRRVENMKQLRVGDTIVITYTEAVALSLEKATGR